jgi:predicted nucleic acid-binding protein
LRAGGHEEEILKLDLKLQTPFYDSTYPYFARLDNLPLVTEDKQMVSKGKEIGLECYSIKEI